MANSFAQELHKHPAIPGEDATRTEEKRDGAGGCFFAFAKIAPGWESWEGGEE